VVKFIIRRRDGSGKARLGLALLPEDLQQIMSGLPIFTSLASVELTGEVLEAVDVYFFRDMEEFRQAMREAGMDPRLVINDEGSGGRFVAPPLEKIGDN